MRLLSLFNMDDLPLLAFLRVDPVNGKVDLSLRLSQVDPEAARKARKEAAAKEEAAFTKSKRVKRKQGTTSDGESMEAR